MKRHVAATLLGLTTLGVLNAHIDLAYQDGRYFGVWQGRQHDVIGWLSDAQNRLWRNCSEVQSIGQGPLQAQVLGVIHRYSPPDSQDAQLLSLQQQGPWLLAELSFRKLNPAVVLLRADGGQVRVAERAVWSGSTAPWHPGPRIRTHLRTQVAQALPAPDDLIACYEPASPGLH